MYALVDCNSFYASCEQIFRPDLAGKPVVVLSNNDGCLVARNAEAKAAGVPDLVPYFQAKPILDRIGAAVFSSNYELYGDISGRVMEVLGGFAGDVEVYSIDEAFLRLLTDADLHKTGHEIRARVLQWVGVPVSVGIAPTKTLAKLANRAAKKIPKLAGVGVLDTKEKWDWLLLRTPTKDVWGVGSRISGRLEDMGIRTAYQLATADPKWLRKNFSVVLERTARELTGEPCLPLEQDVADKQQIICSRSFGRKATELIDITQATSKYAARAAEKLRAQKGLCESMLVWLEGGPFNGPYYRPQRIVKLECATNDSREIAAAATDAAKAMFKPGLRYRKSGVMLMDLRPYSPDQLDFFQRGQSEQSRSLMTALDAVNGRFGRGTMTLAAQGIERHWEMVRNMKSPAYTTSWTDLPTVSC